MMFYLLYALVMFCIPMSSSLWSADRTVDRVALQDGAIIDEFVVQQLDDNSFHATKAIGLEEDIREVPTEKLHLYITCVIKECLELLESYSEIGSIYYRTRFGASGVLVIYYVRSQEGLLLKPLVTWIAASDNVVVSHDIEQMISSWNYTA